ncbi:hypothetical protein [Porphyromonas vaginalis]|uniref:hypothetical protein n=1 Tax=Porphyromonas vaginalis TaxID=3044325 RepID=UPI00260375D8|nr:hypothetical protein [Porphyromonas vaginalis]
MKRITSTLLLLVAGLFALTSCGWDNPITGGDTPQEPERISQWMLPIERYGITLDEATQIEEGRGNKVERSDELMTLTATPQDTKVVQEIVYYFDRAGHYQVARVKFASQESAKQFIDEYLLNNGFVKSNLRTAKASEEIYISAPRGSQVSSVILVDGEQTEPIFWWTNNDNKKTNWLRVDPLQDQTTGIWMPLLPYGATLEMVQLFEARMGHTFDAEASKPDRGVYKFKTGHEVYTQTTYWFDVKTNHFLEESKVSCDTLHRPTPEQLDAYLKAQGFKPTGLKDKEGNPIYYDKSIKLIANVDMNIPKAAEAKKTFRPGIQYYTNSDIEQLLPYEEVDFPMPLFGFEKEKMEDIMKKYGDQDYTATVLPELAADMPFPAVQTRSKYFPTIILWPSDNDESLYGAAMVICTDLKALRSPSLIDRLERRGFVYDKTRSILLPTYINEQEGVMVQIDEGTIITGFSFSPIENFKSASVPMARRLKR